MTVPFDRIVWGAQQCADYLGYSRAEFLRTIRHQEGFPPELANLPRRWQAMAVTEWALAGNLPTNYAQQQQQLEKSAA